MRGRGGKMSRGLSGQPLSQETSLKGNTYDFSCIAFRRRQLERAEQIRQTS